jgi:hypothetical protein
VISLFTAHFQLIPQLKLPKKIGQIRWTEAFRKEFYADHFSTRPDGFSATFSLALSYTRERVLFFTLVQNLQPALIAA